MGKKGLRIVLYGISSHCRTLYCLWLLSWLIVVLSIDAHSSFPPEDQKDDEIFFRTISQEGCEGSSSWCFQSCNRIVLEGIATRVVGRGTSIGTDIDAIGHLVNTDKYVSNGIVNKTAYLTFQLHDSIGYDPNVAPRSIVSFIKINGTIIDDAFVVHYGRKGKIGDIERIRLKVPVELIRFAVRVPGGSPITGRNIIEIITNEGDPAHYECGDHAGFYYGLDKSKKGKWDFKVGEMLLSFRAVSPVVMVHGMESSRNWFTDRGFAEAFDDVRAGYYIAPQHDLADGIDPPAGRLPNSLGNGSIRGSIPKRLIYEIEQAAKEFGAHRVHIVAHSKGGLWSRAALEELGSKSSDESPVAVFSLTTIDTPHKGSVLADISDYSKNHVSSNSAIIEIIGAVPSIAGLPHSIIVTNLYSQLLAGQVRWNASVHDLRPAVVKDFNDTNNLPKALSAHGRSSKVLYRVLASDANINGNRRFFNPFLGKIEIGSETQGWEGGSQYLCQTLYETLQLYYEVKWNKDGWVTGVTYGVPPFDGNDFAVTVESQLFYDSKVQGPKLPFIPFLSNRRDPIKKNHTNVGDKEIGVQVQRNLTTITEHALQELGQ